MTLFKIKFKQLFLYQEPSIISDMLDDYEIDIIQEHA